MSRIPTKPVDPPISESTDEYKAMYLDYVEAVADVAVEALEKIERNVGGGSDWVYAHRALQEIRASGYKK